MTGSEAQDDEAAGDAGVRARDLAAAIVAAVLDADQLSSLWCCGPYSAHAAGEPIQRLHEVAALDVDARRDKISGTSELSSLSSFCTCHGIFRAARCDALAAKAPGGTRCKKDG